MCCICPKFLLENLKFKSNLDFYQILFMTEDRNQSWTFWDWQFQLHNQLKLIRWQGRCNCCRQPVWQYPTSNYRLKRNCKVSFIANIMMSVSYTFMFVNSPRMSNLCRNVIYSIHCIYCTIWSMFRLLYYSGLINLI